MSAVLSSRSIIITLSLAVLVSSIIHYQKPFGVSFQNISSLFERIFPNMNIFGFGSSSGDKDESWRKAASVYDFTVKDLDGQDVSLDKYQGKVLLIVNVASKCGFTRANYKELNELHSKYKDQGLEILGFPCNQFGHQEPGCEVDIKEFLKANNVEWTVFNKVDVNGNDAIPLYKWLKDKQRGTLVEAIKWNFTKFLVDRKGNPVDRYAPNKNPLEFEGDIEKLLKTEA